MSKTRNAFLNKKAFIPFITCGDPDLETTRRAVLEAVEGGADLIELGIPFSDPTAEGPVIQAANIRALSGGVTTDDIFGLVEKLREETDIPLAFMTYANVVFSYGTDRFLERCGKTGIDALIIPDLPFEEKEEFHPACKANGVDLISLIAPTSKDRIERITRTCRRSPTPYVPLPTCPSPSALAYPRPPWPVKWPYTGTVSSSAPPSSNCSNNTDAKHPRTLAPSFAK